MITPMFYSRYLFYGCLLATTLEASTLHQADEALNSTLYEEAIILYQKALDEHSDHELENAIRYRMAMAYVELEQPSNALVLLNQISEPLRREYRLLKSQVEKQLGQYESSLSTLYPLPSDSEIQLLRGQLLYLLSHYNSAYQVLEEGASGDCLGQLYLARTELALGHYPAAAKRLERLTHHVAPQDPLHYEISFVQADLFFRLSDYVKAMESYQKAIPKRNAEKTPWHAETLYQLGLCAQRMAETSHDAKDFQQAEEILNRLCATYPSDRASLALTQCLLARCFCLDDPDAYRRANTVLDYSARDQYCAKLPEARFLRGVNDLYEAKALLSLHRDLEAQPYLQHALVAFSQALDEGNPNPGALQCLILCLGHLKPSNGQQESLRHIEKALTSNTPPSTDQLLFLKGLILANQNPADPLEVAKTFQSVVSYNPNGSYADEALYTLGLWQYHQRDLEQARETLLQIHQRYPQSLHAAEALFWGIRCAEETDCSRSLIQQLLAKLYELYPSSSLAAEAYFTYYAYENYLEGKEDALVHLRDMPKLFPSSPYLINSHYLLGMNASQSMQSLLRRQSINWNAAIEEFQQAELLFDQLYENQLIPEQQLEYFAVLRYRAALERAQANLKIALNSIGVKRQVCFAYSTSCYQDILNTLCNLDLPLSAKLSQSEAYHQLLEECRYGLAQAYLKSDSDGAAQQLLEQMVNQYATETVTRGYYLARVQGDLAALSMKKGDFTQALHQLCLAEEASRGRILSTDERLDLWMQQSRCHETLGNLDTAMRLLSKVINDDSISGLRLKAMLERAKIYEKQERYDLAQKQLIALSRKGGEWAKKAQEKLVKDYDYQQ